MIKNYTSNIRKFNFFDIIKENTVKFSEELDKEEDSTEKKDELDQLNIELDINNISVSNLGQMNALDGVLFINGQATYKKDDKMIRENVIVKVINNEINDIYKMFFVVHYDFSLIKFEEKPYFIVIGSNFDEYTVNEKKKYFFLTSIKIYDATTFLKSRKKIKPEQGIEAGVEPYPKLLKKQIKLLRKISDQKLSCYNNKEDNIEEYESFQNINAFSIDTTFTYAAVNVDKERILLIYGFPNLLECDIKDIKIIYLPQIITSENEINITNLQFGVLKIQNELKRVLYVSTKNSIYYYIWNYKIKKNEIFEKNIELKELNQEKIGAYKCCMAVKGNSLLIGSSNDNLIGEYNNLEFGKTWFFDGQKAYVNYFNDYLLFVVFGQSESFLEIYDRKNQFFVYYKVDKKKIIGICHDSKYIYVLCEEAFNNKSVITLKEKNDKEKFETFYSKKFFDDAVLYAQNLGLGKKAISDISKKHAEYEYNKGNYEKAIEEYIKTINYYEPSIIIQKFMDKSKLNFLIKYLEVIVDNIDIQIKDLEDKKNYIILLLHCYIIQEDIPKLKDFIDKKGKKGDYFSKDLMRTAIDVCLETDNVEIALSLSKQYKLIEIYLQILITKLCNYEKALNVIEEPENHGFEKSDKERIESYLNFSEYYLKAEENISKKFFNSVLEYIDNNKKNLSKKDIVKLLDIFMDSDNFFKKIFKTKIELYELDYTKEMIHRRIILYLDKIEKDKTKKDKIIKILKNEKYIGKYDTQVLFTIFRKKNFVDGVEALSEINKYYQNLLSIYMDKREYDKIINLCKNYGGSEPSFWGASLNYFINKDLRDTFKKEEELDEINKSLEIFLDKLLESKIMLSVNVLDIIYEKNNQIPFSILNNFMRKSLEYELESIEEEQLKFNDYDRKIKAVVNDIKELKTKAYTFNLIKCCECNNNIDIPSIAFKCGHGFHTSCLSSIITDDTECPKCKYDKSNAINEFEKCKNFYSKVDTFSKLEKKIDEEENKNKFIYELYGKGLFNLAKANEK